LHFLFVQCAYIFFTCILCILVEFYLKETLGISLFWWLVNKLTHVFNPYVKTLTWDIVLNIC